MEPLIPALHGGRDGCEVIRGILSAVAGCGTSVLAPGGTLFMEVDVSHPAILPDSVACSTFSSNDGVARAALVLNSETHCDLAGKERFVRYDMLVE